MGFSTDGFVLRAPRTAPGNARTTATATNGVSRDHKALPAGYDYSADLVESPADQYRTAILDNPSGSSEEYLLWSANSGSLTTLEDTSWTVTASDPEATVTIPVGTSDVYNDGTASIDHDDGTDRLVVIDTQGLGLADIRLITIQRGDSGVEIEVGPDAATDFGSQDADAGLVVLPASIVGSATIPSPTTLDGGVSTQRGDSIVRVDYIVAAARFYWTRNDRIVTRFGWNGKVQRWEPLKGEPVRELGVLTVDEDYLLVPRPNRFEAGNDLPGDSSDSDLFTLIRVGIRPDATATVPEVQVVSDSDAADDAIDFGALGDPDAVVGQTNGILIFNPDFITANSGKTVFYTPEQFPPDADGEVGDILGADTEPLFLSPIPGPTDLPLVRLGFRRYLAATAFDDDAALGVAAAPSEGEVLWSKTTGKIRLSDTDVVKSDPDDVGFDVQYIGNKVYYDGVSMTVSSLRTKAPVQLIDESAALAVVDGFTKFFVPNADPLPDPSGGVVGLGISGIIHVPDGTGIIPNLSATPGTRPNGSGLVREVLGVGDTIIFSPAGAAETMEVFEFEDDLKKLPLFLRKGKVQIARELGTEGSRIVLGRGDRRRWRGEALYFLQADVMPAVYAAEARMYSREIEPFTFDGTESLYFTIDGTPYTWTAAAGTFAATAVAASIDAAITGTGTAIAIRGHVVLEAGTVTTGTVEIGFGSSGDFADRDNSGSTVLGFLPGWRVEDPSSNENWLPDNGVSFGVARSPQNKDRSNNSPDFRSRGSFDNTILSNSLIGIPHFSLNNVPLQDVAGYAENVFFLTIDGLNFRLLNNLIDVLYDFSQDRFTWLEAGDISAAIESATGALGLGNAGVIPDSLYGAVATGNGFYLAEDGENFSLQVQGTDFLLPADGVPGIALPIEVIGGLVDSGAAGVFTSGTTTFTDDNGDFLGAVDPEKLVAAGYHLKILAGDAEGTYIVASVTSGIELEVESTVPFPATAGTAGETHASWQIFQGVESDIFDSAVIADVLYEQFNHLASEPFEIRLLASVGDVPATPAAQLTSRNVAIVQEAFQRSREVSIRVGQADGSPELTLTPLSRGNSLGTMANSSLFAPDVADLHFTTEAFTVRVGTQVYTHDFPTTGDALLTAVGAFTDPLTGDTIEYLTTTGELKFGEDTLVDLDQANVVYDEEFLDATDLVAGEVEYDPRNGDLNFGSADITTYAGTTAYFVERMITEDQLDVALSPLGGAFLFDRPLRDGQLVEATYYQADDSGDQTGDQIVEFLPLIIRQEVATLVTDTEYTVNPTGRTIATDVDELIWVDNELQNFGNADDVAFEDGTLTFNEDVDSSAVVQVNYGVFEAFGGEQAYNTSTVPVWRPPFFLEAEQDTFTLEGDRSTEMEPGKLMRLGPQPFYIKESAYDAGTDLTTVTLWPASELEAGSRAPGNDALTLISSDAVTDDVDGTATGGSTGFLLTVDTAVNPFEPVDKGMISAIFLGDLTQFAVAGHLIEFGGYPMIIAGTELTSDGRGTRVNFTSPVLTGFNAGTDVVKLSVRPIYQPEARNFLGVNPFVPTETNEMILFGETDDSGTVLPGRTLVENVHFSIDPESGDAVLLEPLQEPLSAGQRLLFRYTRLKVLVPLVDDGAPLFPRYKAQYAFVSAPSISNGLAQNILAARYTFRNPDSFYYRTVPLEDFMGEVAAIAIERIQGQLPTGGPIVVSGAPTDNFAQGVLGFGPQRRDLTDQDRAARTFIDLYNDVIVAFEQVKETISGEVVGDHDGKFRFFIGRDKTYTPPAYEDDITGDLNPRQAWTEVFLAANETISPVEADIIVDPETASLSVDSEVEGDAMSPFLLAFYMAMQRDIVTNDMDDRVLVGYARARLTTSRRTPRFNVLGEFQPMWKPHRLSRLFPEKALVFTTTFPGLEADFASDPVDPGEYDFFRMLRAPRLFPRKDPEGPVSASTFREPIGIIENPALGQVKDITDANIRSRLPRARVWAYSATGFPDIDDLFSADPDYTATAGFATIIATPGFIRDFPVDPDTGLPDFDRFLTSDTVDSDTNDLQSGDAELSNPSWKTFDDDEDITQQVSFGRPTGETYLVGNSGSTLTTIIGGGLDITPSYGGVFIGVVQAGCVLILADDQGDFLAGSSVLELGEGELSGDPIDVVQGDTIYVIPPDAIDTSDFADPPTSRESRKLARSSPSLDVGVRKRQGMFFDKTLPRGLRWRQSLPEPLTAIEADVEFSNNERAPFELPSLLGQGTNDNGDYGIPYLALANTELDRLGGVAQAFVNVLQTDGPSATGTQIWLAVYPDEIVADDGTILVATDGTNPPAVLVTTGSDLTPVDTAGSYTANTGIGDGRQYDLLFMEVPNTASGIGVGATGILTVGDVSADRVEVPRFVSQSFESDTIKYTFRNALASVSISASAGMVVTRAGTVTTFDTSTVGAPILNDGLTDGVGGLNRIFAGTDNAIIIRLYDKGDGSLVETIVLTDTLAHGGAAGDEAISAITVNEDEIEVTTVSAFATTDDALTVYDFTIDIDTFITGATVFLGTRGEITALSGTPPAEGGGAGSTSAWVSVDRLTFNERVDLSTVPERLTTTASPGLIDITGNLSVWEVEGTGGTATDVNAPAEVNGGLGFTFLAIDFIGTTGSFTVATASPTDELGAIKVLAFEAANTPLGALTDLVFSVAPSSEMNESSTIICSGEGDSHDGENSLVSLASILGAVSTIDAGDVLIVKESADNKAAVKAGTYLVRHTVEEDGGTAGGREVVLSGQASSGGAWVEILFPTITAFDESGLTVDVTDTSGPGPSSSAWDTTGRIYFIPDSSDPSTVISMAYTAIASDVFTVTTGSGLDAAGGALTDSEVFDQLELDMTVSGLVYVPVGSTYASPLPANSVVGFDSAATGATTIGGFRSVTISNPTLNADATTWSVTFAYATTLTDRTDAGFAANDLGVGIATPVDNKDFQADQDAAVYDDVADFLDLSLIDGSTWQSIHGDGTVHDTDTDFVTCVLPMDKFVTTDIVDANGDDAGGTAGFVAEAGIFLEPSFPRPVRPLDESVPHVVDATRSAATDDEIGMRNAADFGLTSPEVVLFEIRRPRRWHEALDAVSENLEPLRFAYEIRRGDVDATSTTTVLVADISADPFTATQLGAFTDSDVNINAGDVVRLLDSDGVLLDTAEVGVVADDGVTLTLRDPGFTEAIPDATMSFEVYLRTATVPHEQSNEQLLELITDQVVFDQVATPDSAGGSVAVANILTDLDGAVDYSSLGIQEGDIIIVDPAGDLAGPGGAASPAESGVRPVGDTAVPLRSNHSDGGPDELDDNRGWYRVTDVSASALEVSGSTEFSGAFGSEVIFGSFITINQEYAVYPVVSDGGGEGQMDLRITAVADGADSYAGNSFSVAPFAYRIIRPSAVFSDQAVDLILFMRERLLSWLEEMGSSTQGGKSGSYYVFQQDDHIEDLGDPTNPEDGLGVTHNLFIESLSGITSVSPFSNTSDCLSVLDRRNWLLDFRLDFELPPNTTGVPPYTSLDPDAPGVTSDSMVGGSGRPVLPDFIDAILDNEDRFRSQRYAWIKFRGDRVTGTLQDIDRFDLDLPRRIEEQEEILRLQEGLDEV